MPTVGSHPKAKDLCCVYLANRLESINGMLGHDAVDDFLAEKAHERATIQCSSCHAMYDVRGRNCTNSSCNVVNIRSALAAQQEVIHGVHHQPKSRRRSDVVIWEGSVKEGMVVMAVDQAKSVSRAECKLVEPCFVNPGSLAAVKELLRHIGQLASVSQYGGSKQEWLAVTCDGVPYMLIRKAVKEAKRLAGKDHLTSLG